jgi:phage terminase large subunit GpA-like protein
MRPFLQVYFACSNSYQRVYRSADNSRYLARCPKCGKEMRFQVGPGGSDQRAFRVSCL